jgi:hypothetical protein
VIFAEGAATESLFAGPTFLANCRISDRLEIMRIAGPDPKPARGLLSVSQARRAVAAKGQGGRQLVAAHQA